MQWIPDDSGRFRWRPFYRRDELDAFCEGHVRRFLKARYSVVTFPLSTDDLTLLIEQEASDLDLHADLSDLAHDGLAIDGVTTFFRQQRPRVQISRTLSLDPRREPRLRTTLAHELGHVLLHDFARNEEDAWALDEPTGELPAICTSLLSLAGRIDWLEWQANYASGALLMPRQAIWTVLRPLLDKRLPMRMRTGSLIDRVQGYFLVSEAAAFVRLRQLGYLANGASRTPLRS